MKVYLDTSNDLNFSDQNGWTCLHHSVKEANIKIVKILLEFNVNINCRSNKKQTPLHISIINGYFDITKLLIEKGASIEYSDDEKNNAFHLCAREGHVEILKYLLENKTFTLVKNLNGQTAYDLATDEKIKELISLSLPSFDFSKSKEGFSSKSPKQKKDGKRKKVLRNSSSDNIKINVKNIFNSNTYLIVNNTYVNSNSNYEKEKDNGKTAYNEYNKNNINNISTSNTNTIDYIINSQTNNSDLQDKKIYNHEQILSNLTNSSSISSLNNKNTINEKKKNSVINKNVINNMNVKPKVQTNQLIISNEINQISSKIYKDHTKGKSSFYNNASSIPDNKKGNQTKVQKQSPCKKNTTDMNFFESPSKTQKEFGLKLISDEERNLNHVNDINSSNTIKKTTSALLFCANKL